MKIIYQKRIYREDLQANPNVYYLFGDNVKHIGLGGQAAEMRGEPNAIGIPTKTAPGMADEDFFNDRDFAKNIDVIAEAFHKVTELPKDSIVVIPLNGLGTGLAELDTRAPRTYSYLRKWMSNL